ncbi:MAG TPA: hypothetical protein VFL31_00425 [Nitrospiraceae bacterium]|nr:hypothetical protein [Nitrospiraceae bacterium]
MAPPDTKRFVLGVDLDGTCADFYEGLRTIAAEWLGVAVDSLSPKVTHGLKEWGVDKAPGGYPALHRFAVTQRDLFRNLKPIAHAPFVLRELSALEIRIRIITHRLFIKYFHQMAVRQTIEWLDCHDIPYWDLCFMADKAAVGADLYIEDAPGAVAELREQKLDVIVFSNSTNRDLDPPRANDWNEVKALVLERLHLWEERQTGRRIARAV